MGFWRGKKVLITGHTGFKGSWLALWLQSLGADVTGYALKPPIEQNLFDLAKIKNGMNSIHGDVRDIEHLKKVIFASKPEIVFHLAAQALVRKSYRNPLETFETNIMGTVNLFETLRLEGTAKVVINVTSDKCYKNQEWVWGYREIDVLGGNDPYSSSKACSELITNAYRKSFFEDIGLYCSSVRAGNVIGGGDWAEDRLVPDIISSIIKKIPPIIRNPNSIRPWQHVLEPLNGYMILAEKMWYEGEKYSDAWNFGPEQDNAITVEELVDKISSRWGTTIHWVKNDDIEQPYESNLLKLDSSKSQMKLGWKPLLTIDETILWTIEWFQENLKNINANTITLSQIHKYEKCKKVNTIE